MKNNPLPRLDEERALRQRLLPHCRLKPGEIWEDPQGQHKVGCLDTADATQIGSLMNGEQASLAIQDPPYNVVAFEIRKLHDFIDWSEQWVRINDSVLSPDSSFYVWIGADQRNAFQPLPDFMVMMRRVENFQARSFLTMRNQQGYRPDSLGQLSQGRPRHRFLCALRGNIALVRTSGTALLYGRY